MKTVGNFPDLASAKLAQTVLADRGIATLIPDEYLAGVDWQLVTAIQGVRLQVAPGDLELAKELLSSPDAEADSGAEESSDPGEQEVCPRCQSDLVGPPPWQRRLKALSMLFPLLLLLWPIFALAGNRTCAGCGLTWKHAE